MPASASSPGPRLCPPTPLPSVIPSGERLAPVAARPDDGRPEALRVRLVATAATDAIRIALETWAATEAGVTGEGSPAALALRCLRQLLGGMGWSPGRG
ncbi:hypothetical protein [Streptomyces tricolor]|uniref:TetR family transcriptional regulator n=1 Tax=Streptomyces bangladeshensis TaxID=295352 RepID=A0ABN3C1L0_9ACTN